jgi:hypothetical protein
MSLRIRSTSTPAFSRNCQIRSGCELDRFALDVRERRGPESPVQVDECGQRRRRIREFRRQLSGQKGYEYLATESARELQPILSSLGHWGMRWARKNLSDDDYDAGLLMLYLQRSIRPEGIPGANMVLRFHFEDRVDQPDWWILVDGGAVDVCTVDPCKDVDVYFTTTVRKMTEVWMGDTTYRAAIRSDEPKVVGPRALIRDIPAWLESCPFHAEEPNANTSETVVITPPASEIAKSRRFRSAEISNPAASSASLYAAGEATALPAASPAQGTG